MSKLEILYPRHDAKIRVVGSSAEKRLQNKIRSFEESEAYIEYKANQEALYKVQIAKPRFKCWKCNKEYKIKDLTLYDFVSPGDEFNYDRYDDYNIICPNCGRFSIYRKGQNCQFKEVKEVYE